jgi:hypothetical protein
MTVRSSVLVSYGEDVSSISARWQFTVHGGKVSQVDFLLPALFHADQFLYSDTVQVREEETPVGRMAHIFLKGAPDEFDIRLRATVPLPAARGLVKLDLPWPRDAESESSRLYLASTPDINLEPTPNLVPDDDPADDALVKELNGAGVAFRAFECRSLLDQVAFRLSKSSVVTWHQMHALMKFDDDSVLVRQDFEFTTQGIATRQLRFAVPEPIRGSVRVESAPPGAVSDTISEELVLRLGSQLPDPLRVQLSYRWPYPAQSDSADPSIAVPLITASNSRCELTEVAVNAPRTVQLRVQGDGWRAVSSPSVQGPLKEEAQWMLRQVGSATRLAFQKSAVAWLPRPGTVVDRALHETVVDSQGRWRTRSRFVLTDSDSKRVSIRIPQNGRLARVRWNGQIVPVQPGSESGIVEVIDALPGEAQSVLEIETDSLVAARPAAWGSFAWDIPSLQGDIIWGKVFWQIDLPDGMAIVRGPTGYSDENDLQWHETAFRLIPRQDESSLERWLTGSTERRVAVPSGQRLLYSRLLSDGPLEMVVARDWLLVLFSSGLVLVVGLAFVVLPRRVKVPFVIVVLLATVLFAAIEPQATSACMRSAGWGLLLAVPAGICHVILMRRRSVKQSVFPEPAHLTSTRGGSGRAGTGEIVNAGAAASNASDGATHVPRLAASSSSIRR